MSIIEPPTKKVMLYQSSKNLPKEGWLQQCTMCNEVTGNTMSVLSIYVTTQAENRNVEYIAYICLKCENKVMCRVHYINEIIHRIKHKFFRTMNKTIINHLRHNNIYHYSIGNVNNTSYNHTELTAILREYTYFPVEPKPPAPLDVSSNSSTNSTRETDDKSGVQI